MRIGPLLQIRVVRIRNVLMTCRRLIYAVFKINNLYKGWRQSQSSWLLVLLERKVHCFGSYVFLKNKNMFILFLCKNICYGTTTMFSSRYEKMFLITFLPRASLCFQKTGISQRGQLVYEDLSMSCLLVLGGLLCELSIRGKL